MTGIELIAKERQEQIEKHGYDAEWIKHNPQYYDYSQMAIVARLILTGENELVANWPQGDIDKIRSKPWK